MTLAKNDLLTHPKIFMVSHLPTPQVRVAMSRFSGDKAI
jgi:hypothetical protein